ncbi:MAG: hypothetical protein NTV74_04515 [Euryarchaeota archaeon]|nr:hypothetical protein [Euryarchaeota archaeon]
MKDVIFRKGLVAMVVALFIGLSVAPGMSAVNPGTSPSSGGTLVGNNDLVKITVSLCKTDGIENYTFMLTKEKANALNILIDNFQKDLNNSKTKEETVALYNSMVESLYGLGLIPGGMSVEETQQLVTGNDYAVGPSEYDNIVKELTEQLSSKEKQEELISRLNDAVVKLDEKGMLPSGMSVEEAQSLVTERIHEISNNVSVSEIEKVLEMENNENFFCLMTGTASGTLFLGPLAVFSYLFGAGLWFMFSFLFNPLQLGSMIYLGNNCFSAFGWISTIGLNGKKSWDGDFYGALPIPPLPIFIGVLWEEWYPGVFGFTGIKILGFAPNSKTFFLGAALWVDYSIPTRVGNQQETPFSFYNSMQNSLINQQSNQLLQQVVSNK